MTKEEPMKLAVLIVMTSHDTLGGSGRPTGTFLPEVAHAYRVFESAGLDVDFVSVRGGSVPLEGLEFDAETIAFSRSDAPMRRLHESLSPDQVEPGRYAAIYYAGGHGTMWDFPDHERLQAIAEAIDRRGGVISAVCHGPAGLVNLSNPDGTPLVKGRRIATFTNAEERAVEKETIVPFALQTRLEERGAKVVVAEPFKANVVVDGRLITGQNPASARGVAQEVVRALRSARTEAQSIAH